MIYIVRHGQTDGNLTKIVRGKKFDDSLNEIGIQQAKDIAKELKNINFSACYCSPLKRTRQTCEIIYNANPIYDERIMPRDYSDFAGGSVDEMDKQWLRTDDSPKGIESVLSFERRVFEFLNEIVKKHKGKDVLIVTHASTCRIIRGYIYGLPEDNDYMSYGITKNCEILKIDN